MEYVTIGRILDIRHTYIVTLKYMNKRLLYEDNVILQSVSTKLSAELLVGHQKIQEHKTFKIED